MDGRSRAERKARITRKVILVWCPEQLHEAASARRCAIHHKRQAHLAIKEKKAKAPHLTAWKQ